MTPVFDSKDGSKRLIMLPNKWLHIKYTKSASIKNAERIVYSALDRLLPYAYKTVKKQFYLTACGWKGEPVDTVEEQARYVVTELEEMRDDKDYLENTRTVHRAYVQCSYFDAKAKNIMTSNYHKLEKALELLHREGYVHSYHLRSTEPVLRIRWECDVKHEKIKYDKVDYSFPATYKSPPSKIRMKYRSKFKRLNNMRDSGFPIRRMDEITPQGMLVVTSAPTKVFEGRIESQDMVKVHDVNDESFKLQNKEIYRKGMKLRNWFIITMAKYGRFTNG